jgi:riboflavin synthase
MFTGLVEELGTVVAREVRDDAACLRVRGDLVPDLVRGDSVAVNGVCLTVTEHSGDIFGADVMAETLHRTALAATEVGDPVNLERAMPVTGRLGGHIVQGHVDGIGTVVDRRPGSAWETVVVELPTPLLPYVVEKGSIALDGVSLTITAVTGRTVAVGLIPETLRRTTLGHRPPGAVVNIEVDVLAKHVERLLAFREGRT